MKIKILGSASQDLIDGYWFYENQSEGIGSYLLDAIYSDIDFLIINAEIYRGCSIFCVSRSVIS